MLFRATSLDSITAEIIVAKVDEINEDQQMEEYEVVDYFDQLWSVHSILDRLIENGVTSYLIKWQPVGEWEPSWEPSWNVNAPEKVAQYERRRWHRPTWQAEVASTGQKKQSVDPMQTI